MSMQDPITDMLNRIKNAQARAMREVSMPSSKFKIMIVQILKEEGYIADYRVETRDGKPVLIIALKYFEGKPVIDMLQRVSKPGCRVYCTRNDLPKVMGGLGVAIVSTSKGMMTDRAARKQGLGGEIICLVA